MMPLQVELLQLDSLRVRAVSPHASAGGPEIFNTLLRGADEARRARWHLQLLEESRAPSEARSHHHH